jgi:hypothetical protein
MLIARFQPGGILDRALRALRGAKSESKPRGDA